jgi:hypothetical protein
VRLVVQQAHQARHLRLVVLELTVLVAAAAVEIQVPLRVLLVVPVVRVLNIA